MNIKIQKLINSLPNSLTLQKSNRTNLGGLNFLSLNTKSPSGNFLQRDLLARRMTRPGT
jgi:hypothetical protein